MLPVETVATIVVLAASAQVAAQPQDPAEIRKPYMIVLMTARDAASGLREANRAADRLGYAVAPDTLRKPEARRTYVGAVVTLHRAADNRFEVTSFLGDEGDAVDAFKAAQKYYAHARMVPVELPKNATDEWIDTPFYRLGILVVGSYRSYGEALRAAKSLSARSGLPYGDRGMIYDKKRGLIWPDDNSDEMWAGRYAPRRYDNECDMAESGSCLTVERSGAYEGFTPGLYIVVSGVLDRTEDRATRLAAAREVVPGAYVKQTTVYLGCTH